MIFQRNLHPDWKSGPIKFSGHPTNIGLRDVVWTIKHGISYIQDASRNYDQYVEMLHQNYRLATVQTETRKSRFDACIMLHGVRAIISNIRPICAKELYAELAETPTRVFGKKSFKDPLGKIPRSLQTYTFYKFLKQFEKNRAELGLYTPAPETAPIMTFKQLQKAHSGHNLDRSSLYVRLFTANKIHNEFEWKIGTNTCKTFDLVTTCGNGLYFIKNGDQHLWTEYGGKKMQYQAIVHIAPDEIVCVESYRDNAGDLRYKYKTKTITIIEFLDLYCNCDDLCQCESTVITLH